MAPTHTVRSDGDQLLFLVSSWNVCAGPQFWLGCSDNDSLDYLSRMHSSLLCAPRSHRWKAPTLVQHFPALPRSSLLERLTDGPLSNASSKAGPWMTGSFHCPSSALLVQNMAIIRSTRRAPRFLCPAPPASVLYPLTQADICGPVTSLRPKLHVRGTLLVLPAGIDAVLHRYVIRSYDQPLLSHFCAS